MFYNFLKYFVGFFVRLLYPYKVENMPPIEDKSYILVANHKSSWDPLIISIFFPRPIRWMAKKELYDIPIVKFIFDHTGVIGVERGHGDPKSTIQAMRVLRDGEVLGIFPEGTRVQNPDYHNGKSGTALLASRTGTDILPIYIDGEYKPFRRRRYIFRDPIPFEKKKLSTEQYEEIMYDIMKNIYEGE
ncbi:MAG: lysophospholipid acyltransferase family protein [Peptoniphilus sp.]|nr:lysophospholipid acyltransferase family protein [Peptoniphilus sp.]MDD7362927.1 lysophospholipid acyltransferase family protein [Bacillota bacterium]MDY6044167.1 lysophospholipid acyltransferase family protein [Peptoniphilus sp.]